MIFMEMQFWNGLWQLDTRKIEGGHFSLTQILFRSARTSKNTFDSLPFVATSAKNSSLFSIFLFSLYSASIHQIRQPFPLSPLSPRPGRDRTGFHNSRLCPLNSVQFADHLSPIWSSYKIYCTPCIVLLLHLTIFCPSAPGAFIQKLSFIFFFEILLRAVK